jgi:tRNA 2-thiouridine synthesizing protein A
MAKTTLLDLRGAGCADVLIRLAALARDATDANQQVIVWTDDRGAPTELPSWCRMTHHRYVGPLDSQPDHYLLTLYPKDES